MHATLDDWVASEAIGFSLDSSPDAFDAAVDRMMASLGSSVELLGFGEAMHGGEEILVLRNRLFRRLVEVHGYTAIAVESSFPRGTAVDAYAGGRAGAAPSYDAVKDAGFSHGFGALEANRELIEWMRAYNTDPSRPGDATVRFYGFDSPTEMTGTDSPRRLLHAALDYLATVDRDAADVRRRRIDELLGDDAAWENPAAMMDPTKSIGLSPAAAALRIEAEDLLTDLQLRRPALAARRESDNDEAGAGRYLEAVQHAAMARQFLGYHAGLARNSPNRIAELLGLRDLMMADALAYAVARERRRGGKVLAFAHNSHLKRGRAAWQLGPHALAWWPAGAHAAATLGPRYAVVGTGVGTSDANGIGQPEPGTLEARLTASAGPARFIPTQLGRSLAPLAVADLPTRSGSTKNHGYFPFTAQSLTDFDGVIVLDSATYTRGGPPLP